MTHPTGNLKAKLRLRIDRHHMSLAAAAKACGITAEAAAVLLNKPGKFDPIPGPGTVPPEVRRERVLDFAAIRAAMGSIP